MCPIKKLQKLCKSIFHVQDFSITENGTSLQLPTGRIPVTELEGLLNVLLQGQAYKGHWITKS